MLFRPGSINCSSLFVNDINLVDNFNENIYLTSNDLINFTNETFNRLQNSNLVGFNSTLVDFKSIITSNIFIVNSSEFSNTHTCTYHKFFPDSEILIHADFPYKINGFGSDHYASRLKITSELNLDPEYSLEHEQIFIGYAAGGGTRSTTLSPLNYKTEIPGTNITIKVQLKLNDSDNYIITDKCSFGGLPHGWWKNSAEHSLATHGNPAGHPGCDFLGLWMYVPRWIFGTLIQRGKIGRAHV